MKNRKMSPAIYHVAHAIGFMGGGGLTYIFLRIFVFGGRHDAGVAGLPLLCCSFFGGVFGYLVARAVMYTLEALGSESTPREPIQHRIRKFLISLAILNGVDAIGFMGGGGLTYIVLQTFVFGGRHDAWVAGLLPLFFSFFGGVFGYLVARAVFHTLQARGSESTPREPIQHRTRKFLWIAFGLLWLVLAALLVGLVLLRRSRVLGP